MRDDSILTRIHQMRPVDTRFIAGRWHPGRVALGGITVEARVFLKSLITPKTKNRRFLVIGRARSGTTLLTRLLNGHSQIQCDGEVLARRVLGPLAHLDRLASKSAAPVYGAKLLSYQMVQVMRLQDPRGFLRSLAAKGVTLIHLERDTFSQTLSLAVAQNRKQFHSDRGAKALEGKLHLEPDQFVDRLVWSDALLRYELAALEGLEPLYVNYDQDLSDPETQIETLDRICGSLGVIPETAQIPLKKVLPTDPRQIIENYDDVIDAMKRRRIAHLLPEGET